MAEYISKALIDLDLNQRTECCVFNMMYSHSVAKTLHRVKPVHRQMHATKTLQQAIFMYDCVVIVMRSSTSLSNAIP